MLNNDNKKRLKLVVGILLVLYCFTGRTGFALDIYNADVVEAFVDGVVKSGMQQHHSPSGVVMIVKDGEIIFTKGYGYQDIEKQIPVDPAVTLFRAGSVSKLFTWVSVMQLVEQGKLDLDTDVNRYIHSFQIADSWPGQPVTLRHIMTHTTGFEDGFLGYLIIDNPDSIVPLAQSLAKHQPVRINPPGKHTAYSNWASALAGLIVANVCGESFESYVQRHIFDVLDMRQSTFTEPLPEYLADNMAIAYAYQAGRYIKQPFEIIANFAPAGSLTTTAYDMSRFARALLNGGELEGKRILKTQTLQQMINEGFSHGPGIRGMAMGFIRYPYEGIEVIGHDGSTTLFMSHLGLSLSDELMVFLSFSGAGARKVRSAFKKTFYDSFFPAPVALSNNAPSNNNIATDSFQYTAIYAGTYLPWRSNFSDIESILRLLSSVKVVALPDNTLLIGGQRYRKVDANLFRELHGNRQLLFQTDTDGSVIGFIKDGMAVTQYYRAPVYEFLTFNTVLVVASLLTFIGVFLQLIYQWNSYRSLLAVEKSAVHAALLVAAVNLIFFILAFIALIAAGDDIMYAVPTLLKFVLLLPLLAVVAALYHLFYSIRVWQLNLFTGIGARVRYNIVTLAALSLIWFYVYWNLLGGRY